MTKIITNKVKGRKKATNNSYLKDEGLNTIIKLQFVQRYLQIEVNWKLNVYFSAVCTTYDDDEGDDVDREYGTFYDTEHVVSAENFLEHPS